LESEQAFAERFYRSLAVMLSRRLRITSMLVPPLIVENVPQLRRIHAGRVGTLVEEELPETIIAAVDQFKKALTEANRKLTEEAAPRDEAEASVYGACRALHDELAAHVEREQEKAGSIGTYVLRETFPFFMRSSLIERCYEKPRGYAGDFRTVSMIYENRPSGDGVLGLVIDRWALSEPVCQAARHRLGHMNRVIRDLAEEWTASEPMPLASLASGCALELVELCKDGDAPDFHATCIDVDPEAVRFAKSLVDQRGISSHFSFVLENPMRLCGSRASVQLAPQHLIYSLSLANYLQDDLALRLIDWVYGHLLPGGSVVLGNLHPENPNRVFMEQIVDWEVRHRTEEELRQLFLRSRFKEGGLEVVTDDTGAQLFVRCRKPHG
ncbi:class I SAM-dependent methyltransferase family protein, partial [Planctomycetota bacterium]